ncbi:ABC transporter substrate-binding protein [Dactylosporangium sp. NPDC051541]|uniref:ABC transporter substrate-binding protein n=1 Tax=Dactylosporangium sp. NPDC051541 TaxID=3363977 RepID=UPI0037B16202
MRIISLSPSATEILFALHVGNKVVAVDDKSNYPSAAPHTELSGFQPNSEAIARYEPDLVILTNDVEDAKGGRVVHNLQQKDVRVSLEPAPATLDELYLQIADIGKTVDAVPAADALINEIKQALSETVKKTPSKAKGKRIYHELDPSRYSATSATFVGSIYALFGLRNIADPFDQDRSGYPRLDDNAIIKANPDFIFLADTKCCVQNATAVASRKNWSKINAVKNKAVIELDDDIASRWGPRVVDLARAISAAIAR